MAKISKLDLNQLNTELRKIDRLQDELAKLREQHAHVTDRVGNLEHHAAPTSNNLIFTWTGSTHTLSWTSGSVKDKKGFNVPIKAGSLVLSASTYYWLAWNKVHFQMAANSNVEDLLQNQVNVIVCQIFTGTAGQTGVAGGGGSTGVTELSGAKYKNF